MLNNVNWKRRLKRLGIGLLGLLALLLLVNMTLNWWAGAKLEAKLEKLRAAGEPVSIADMTPDAIPDDRNAAVHLQRMEPELRRFEGAMVEFLENTPLGKAYDARYEDVYLPTVEQAAAMQEVLNDFEELTTAIDQMSELKEYASQLDYSLEQTAFLEEILLLQKPIRTLARFLNWKIQVYAVQGDAQRAVETGMKLLRITRLFDNEPTLVNHLVGIACRDIAVRGISQALRSGAVTAELREALEAELALHDDPRRFFDMLKTERPISLDAMASWRVSVPVPITWHFTFWQSDAIDYFQEQRDLAQLPWHEGRTRIGDASSGDYPTLIQLLTPAMQSAFEAFHRNIATVRCLRILNAVGAYREERGEELTQLSDLGLPASVTQDPFTGQPLLLRKLDNGWLVYSAFKNGVDDGGEFAEQQDWGLAPLAEEVSR